MDTQVRVVVIGSRIAPTRITHIDSDSKLFATAAFGIYSRDCRVSRIFNIVLRHEARPTADVSDVSINAIHFWQVYSDKSRRPGGLFNTLSLRDQLICEKF